MIEAVWCERGSRTARMLAKSLGVRRLRRWGVVGKASLLLLSPPPTPPPPGSLNSRMCWRKLNQHLNLGGAGLPTLEVCYNPPVDEVQTHLWIPRSAAHGGGDDFLPGAHFHPAYWTKWEEVEKEFRFHILGGVSVKAGGKVPREGATPHPTIRSGQFGWAISYGERGRVGITKEMRELAKEAAEVCQMDAGVVDVWKLQDGRILVGELNVRPGMDEPTVLAWVNRLREM